MKPTSKKESEQTAADVRTDDLSATKSSVNIAEQPAKEDAAPLKQIEQMVWNVRTADLPKSKAFPLAIERVLLLTGKNFIKNKCGLRASSLTFLTLMSVVPLVALLLGIARGFNFEEMLREKLVESFVGQEQVAEWILSFADTALKCGFPEERMIFCADMKDVISHASSLAEVGDTVLLSPASASWGMYNNFEERGEDFKQLVLALEE